MSKDKREIKKECRQKKRKYLESRLENLKKEYNKRNFRKFYIEVAWVKKEKAWSQIFIKDKDSKLLGEFKDIKRRRKEYFNDILNETILHIN